MVRKRTPVRLTSQGITQERATRIQKEEDEAQRVRDFDAASPIRKNTILRGGVDVNNPDSVLRLEKTISVQEARREELRREFNELSAERRKIDTSTRFGRQKATSIKRQLDGKLGNELRAARVTRDEAKRLLKQAKTAQRVGKEEFARRQNTKRKFDARNPTGAKAKDRAAREAVSTARAQREAINQRSFEKGQANKAAMQASIDARNAPFRIDPVVARDIARRVVNNNSSDSDRPLLRASTTRETISSRIAQSPTARDTLKLGEGLSLAAGGGVGGLTRRGAQIGLLKANNAIQAVKNSRTVRNIAGVIAVGEGASEATKLGTRQFVVEGTPSLTRDNILRITQQGIQESRPEGPVRGFVSDLSIFGGDSDAFRSSVGRQLAAQNITGSEFQSALAQSQAARRSLATGELITNVGIAATTERLFSSQIANTFRKLPSNLATTNTRAMAFNRGASVVGGITATAGVAEGASVGLAQSNIRTGQRDLRAIGTGAVAGGLTAGVLGGAIGGLSVSGRTGAARAINLGANVGDPFEGAGDVLVAGARRVKRSPTLLPAVRRGRGGSRVLTADFFGGRGNRGSFTPTRTNTFGTFDSRSFTANPFSPTPSFSFSPTPSPTPSPSVTPTPTFTPSSIFTPTNVFTPTPTPTRSNTNTKTSTSTLVPTNTGFGFFPLFGIGNANRRLGRGRGRRGVSSFKGSFAPSFAAIELGITAKSVRTPRRGFTGLGIRPVLSNGRRI